MVVRADTADFRRLFARSSLVDKKLKTALRRNIRAAAGRAAQAAREQVQQPAETESAHPHHTGLRDRIAAGISVKVMTGARAGVTIVASSKAMRPGEESLVKAWEKERGWRHPVFGKAVWASQRGRPYFVRTISERQPAVRAAVEEAMREAARSLERP